MEFKYSNKDQIYAKPTVKKDEIPEGAKELNVIYIPPFSGISTDETTYVRGYQNILIGQGKSGDILRNLLKEVSEKESDWKELCEHVKKYFNCELTPPQEGAFILCEYRRLLADDKRSMPLDINTAGSGFQQVLLLLAFLYARPASVLLVDEPDAHLHFNLQRDVYSLLKEITEQRSAQLIIATHSEVIINNTDATKILSFFGKHPKRLADPHDRKKLSLAMQHLSSLDLLKAEQSENRVLFVEDESDFQCLRVLAKILKHSVYQWFEAKAEGVSPYYCTMKGKRPHVAKHRFDALLAAYPKIKGFIVVDSDNESKTFDGGTASGISLNNPDIKLWQWKRYEIENYLINPNAIQRFIEKRGGLPLPGMKKMSYILPPAFMENPLKDPTQHMKSNKGKTILAEIFTDADVNIGNTEYYQLAEIMLEEEVHDDVRHMLNAMAKHFNIN